MSLDAEPLDPSRVGMGCMRLSTDLDRDVDAAKATLAAALAAGVSVLDTAASYGHSNKDLHHNERLIAEVLSASGAHAFVATKCGMRRPGGRWQVDGRRKTILVDAEESRRALQVESLDLLLLHAPDPKTPLETSVRALASARSSGVARRIGLCNVTLTQLERALEITPIDAVQVALSPFDEEAARGGLIERCVSLGIPVFAHSPLGGPPRIKALRKNEALQDLADGFGMRLESLVLAWLRSFEGVLPIPGIRRQESVDPAAWAPLRDDARAMMDETFPLGPLLRTPRGARRPARSRGQVTVFVGIPAAGKSTRALASGAVRLSRDERGGTLAQLADALDQELEDGATDVVMDATYPTRAQRNRVIETAWSHGLRARCVWLDTTLPDAQVNAVERMLRKTGKLLTPEEMAARSKDDPTLFPPMAQYRFADRFEPPSLDEGFDEVERFEFERIPIERDDAGLIVDLEAFGALGAPPDLGLAKTLAARFADAQILVVGWAPKGDEESLRDAFEPARAILEANFALCTHPPGAPKCWCRRPLPGLPIAWMHAEGVAPSKTSYLVAAKGSDRLAAQLGVEQLDVTL